jgi:hypothetical protein
MISDLDIDTLCLWLCTEESKDTAEGVRTIASIIVQLLQSTMMPLLLADVNVCRALSIMMETNNVHLGLDAINNRLVSVKDEIVLRYMDVLWSTHGQLIDPPFTYLDSMVWYYQPWPVSHFNNLLYTPR